MLSNEVLLIFIAFRKNEKCKMIRNFYYAKFRPFGIYKKAFHF
jgi:hypothetical protein